MKRTQALETLSWEHHDGLVVSLRVKKGLEKGADPVTIQQYALHIAEPGLLNHFRQEEEALFPHLAKINGGKKLLDRTAKEHKEMLQNVKEIKNPGDNLTQILKKFSELLNDHIRYEERELFPFIEEHFSKDQLNEADVYLHKEYKALGKDWGPEFWQ